MAVANGSSEPEYYFDVVSQRWWILRPGAKDWEGLSQKDAELLGIHDAVLQQHCTFVDTTLEDYQEAVSRLSSNNKQGSNNALDSKEGANKSNVDRRMSILHVQEDSGAAESSNKSSAASSTHNGATPRAEPPGSGRSLQTSSKRLDSADKETSLKEMFIRQNLDSPTGMTAYSGMNDSMASPSSKYTSRDESPVEEPLRRTLSSSHEIAKQLSILLTDVSKNGEVTSEKEEGSIEKIDSFVRSAVRQLTEHDKSNLGDSLKAVAEERERMLKMATMKPQDDKPKHYSRMMERARTMAAVSKVPEKAASKVKVSKAVSMLLELQREVSKEKDDNDHMEASFDGSSDSDSHDGQSTPSDTVEKLMSQRLSLRRSLSRDGSNSVLNSKAST